MVEKDNGYCKGCCVKHHKLFILIVNFILFIAGVFEVVLSVNAISAEADSAQELSRKLLGDKYDFNIGMILFYGVVLICLSFLGCMSVKRKTKCMIWTYACFIIFIMICEAMNMGISAVLFTFGKPIHEFLWKELDNDSVINIEKIFECCSFNGTDTENTWAGDVAEYSNCTSTYSWNPMKTCWEKFGSTIDIENHNLEHNISYFIVIQMFVCVSMAILIQKITTTEEINTEDVTDAEKPFTKTNNEQIKLTKL